MFIKAGRLLAVLTWGTTIRTDLELETVATYIEPAMEDLYETACFEGISFNSSSSCGAKLLRSNAEVLLYAPESLIRQIKVCCGSDGVYELNTLARHVRTADWHTKSN